MNFLGMGPMELLLIIVLALIVFGPAKLPEIMAQVGKALNDFRRATSTLSEEFNKTIAAELQEGRSVLEDTRAAVSDVHASVNSVVTGVPAPTRVAAPGEGLTAANGTTPEPYVDGYPETRITNGTLPTPPLADTAGWSWETSAEGAPEPVMPPAETASTEPSPTVSPDAALTEPIDPPSTTHERKGPDELLPPY